MMTAEMSEVGVAAAYSPGVAILFPPAD